MNRKASPVHIALKITRLKQHEADEIERFRQAGSPFPVFRMMGLAPFVVATTGTSAGRYCQCHPTSRTDWKVS
jgi:hypothetical protein